MQQWQCEAICDQSLACVQSTRVVDSNFPVHSNLVDMLVTYHKPQQGTVQEKVNFTAATIHRHLQFTQHLQKGTICINVQNRRI